MKKENNGLFSKKAALKFFKKFTGSDMLLITPKIIEECFVFSLMTVYNEKLNSRKYSYLIFVEF